MDDFDLVEDPDSGAQIQLPEWLFVGSTYEQTINGMEATFCVETAREHRRIQTLMYESDILETVV